MWVSISLHPQQHLLLSVFLNFSYPSSYFTGCVVVFWRRSRPTRSAVEVSVFQYTYTRTTEVLWGKRDSKATLSRGECLWSPWPLPQGGSTKSLALTSLYRFFRPLTSKKVLFYYTTVCLGWFSLADNREDVIEYIKGGHLQCKRRNGWNGFVPYLEDLAQIL